MQYSVVNTKDLNAEFRIDSEYYKPTNLTSENIVKKHKYELLGNVCKLIPGPFGSDVTTDKYDTASNCRYIRGKDIQSFFVDQNDKIFIQESLFKKLAQFHLKERDILITVVGMKFGKVAIVYPDDCPALFSCKSTLLRNPSVNVFYLAVYLSSKIGYRLVRRGQRGAAQPGINLFDIQNIPVPIFSTSFQNDIEGLIKKARSYLHNSTIKYSEAVSILLSEVGLLNWKPKHQLTFVKNFSDTQNVARLDAEYFQPKYDAIVNKINMYDILELSDNKYFKIITGTYTKKYSSEGEYYIRSVDINNDLTIETNSMYKTQEKMESKFKVKTGDIVTSRVGSIGTLGYITKELDESYISDNILRIRNYHKNLDSLFLAFFLKQIGSMLMDRLSRGSVQQRLNQETLKEIEIPLIDFSAQQKITDKIRESHGLKKQSKQLLEAAKKAVEMAIEESEEDAETWLIAKMEKANA